MVKSSSHIDVLFRDGLKTTEILPPESVWENIEPFIKKRRNKGILIRLAAGIALLTSLGAMAYYITSTVLNINPDQQAQSSGNFLSTLFDASLINIVVDDQKYEKGIQDGLYTAQVAKREIDDNFILNDSPAGVFVSQTVNLSDRVDDNSLRYSHPPNEVRTGRSPSVVLVSEMITVEHVGRGKVDKRWEMEAKVSPTYLSPNLKAANVALSQVPGNENAVLSYTGGLTVGYRMSNRLSIQTGLYYSSLGRQVNGVNSYSGFRPFAGTKGGTLFGVITSSGTVNSTNNNIYLADASGDRIDSYYSVDNFDPVKSDLTPFGNQIRQNFEYLEIPVLLKYKVIDRKVDFNILGGMAYNFLVGNQAWAVSENGAKVLIGSTEGVDNLLLSSSLGMSMEYNLNERFSFNLEPQVRYFLNTGGDLGSGNPYTFGIFSGMQFRF